MRSIINFNSNCTNKQTKIKFSKFKTHFFKSLDIRTNNGHWPRCFMTNLKYKLSHEFEMTVILLTSLRPVDMREKNKKTHAFKTQCIRGRRFLQTSDHRSLIHGWNCIELNWFYCNKSHNIHIIYIYSSMHTMLKISIDSIVIIKSWVQWTSIETVVGPSSL